MKVLPLSFSVWAVVLLPGCREQDSLASTRPDPAAVALVATAVTDLGTLGGNTSQATAVNDLNQVAGWSQTAAGSTHAFLWQSGQMTDLGTLGGGTSQADAVNSLGQVVGRSSTAAGDTHVFLWSAGVIHDLGPAFPSRVLLNDRGQVAWTGPSAPITHGFLWTNGTTQDLGSLGGRTVVEALNDRGAIVGFSGIDQATQHGFLWRAGTMIDLGSLGGSSEADDINGNGQVVGTAFAAVGTAPNVEFIGHAVLWDNGQMIDLGALSGDVHSGAVAINGSHRVAANSFPQSFFPAHAFQWERGVVTPLSPTYQTDQFEFHLAGISNQDIIAGTEKSITTSIPRAVVWSGGSPVQLATLGGSSSASTAINQTGAVVGWAATASGAAHAALWQVTGAVVPPAAPVASVTVSPASATGNVGDAAQFTATTKDANGNVLTGRTVTWSSTNTAVVTVNATGYAQAVGPGSAALVATSEGKSGQSQITVNSSAGAASVATQR